MDINYFSSIPFWISVIESWISIHDRGFWISVNCKSISVIELQTFIISIIDICVYPRYIYRYHTSMAMGKGLGRLVQYHLCTGRPLVKWLEISSRGFHPEQPTGHTATYIHTLCTFPGHRDVLMDLYGGFLWVFFLADGVFFFFFFYCYFILFYFTFFCGVSYLTSC